MIDDLGCGALIDLAAYGLPHEPMVQEAVAAGADVVLFRRRQADRRAAIGESSSAART